MNKTRLILAALLAFSSLAAAQYPDHAITMIVPFPPGGVADTVARPVADAMTRELKQPVVIENKPGAAAASAWRRSPRPSPTATRSCCRLLRSPCSRKPTRFWGARPCIRSTSCCRLRGSPPTRRCSPCARMRRGRRCRTSSTTPGRTGQIYVWVVGQLRDDACADGDVRRRHRHQDGPRAVHGAGPAIVGLLGGQVDVVATGPRPSCST